MGGKNGMKMPASDGIKRPTLFALRSKLGTNLSTMAYATLCKSYRNNRKPLPARHAFAPRVHQGPTICQGVRLNGGNNSPIARTRVPTEIRSAVPRLTTRLAVGYYFMLLRRARCTSTLDAKFFRCTSMSAPTMSPSVQPCALAKSRSACH